MESVAGVTIQEPRVRVPIERLQDARRRPAGPVGRNADGVRLIGNRMLSAATQGACGYEDGVRVISSAGFRAANNTVRDFKSDGISIEDGCSGKVDGNTIQFYHRASGSRDDGDGDRVVGGARAEVTDNAVGRSRDRGHAAPRDGIVAQHARALRHPRQRGLVLRDRHRRHRLDRTSAFE
ncbi:MAG: right-handed parallel beta-helix repeat-containing protein [Chloroflexota bacterium]